MSADFLILGEGYTGSHLKKRLVEMYPQADIQVTHRRNSTISFELENEGTWQNLPTAKNIFWLFAAKDKKLSQKLFRESFKNSRVIVVSTTSHFLIPDGSEVTEDSPIDTTLPRAEAEEILREEGASILHAAGIYGVNRNPLDWFKNGKILDLNKYLNLTHVEDLSEAIILSAEKAKPGERLISADGQALLWSEIIRRWIDPKLQDSTEPRKGKRVNPRASLRTLGLTLKYKNAHEGIQAIQTGARLKSE